MRGDAVRDRAQPKDWPDRVLAGSHGLYSAEERAAKAARELIQRSRELLMTGSREPQQWHATDASRAFFLMGKIPERQAPRRFCLLRQQVFATLKPRPLGARGAT
jgi:hypothetical protein